MKRSLFALALAAALPLSAQAAELSYTYVEGGYTNEDFSSNGGGVGFGSPDGYFLGGSYNFADTGFFIAGSYSATSTNINFFGPNFNVDFDRTLIGVGYHHSVSDKADFVGQIDYADTGIDSPFGNDSYNGYRVSAGFRGNITDKLEGSVMARYEDFNDFSNTSTGVSVDAQYKLNETLGIIGGVEIGKRIQEDVVVYNIGLRASF